MDPDSYIPWIAEGMFRGSTQSHEPLRRVTDALTPDDRISVPMLIVF